MIGSRTNRRPDARRREIAAGIGGLLVLALIAWISYTSSDGLPWQGGYELTAEVPNAERLAKGNEVAVAGQRIGRVESVDAVSATDGAAAHARISLVVDDDERIPEDSAVLVRPDSVLGASYLEIRPGQSPATLSGGDEIPLERAETRTQLTDLFEVFDRSTARNVQRALAGLAGGFAGRGVALNATLESFAEAMPPLERVSRLLARGETRLADFIAAYARVADELGPAAPQLAGAVRGAGTTFGAIAGEGEALTQSLRGLAPAESAAARALHNVQPGLANLAAAMRDLNSAGPLLVPALGRANLALAAGTLALIRVPRLAGDLRKTLSTLGDVTADPATDGALRKLTETFTQGADLFEILGAAQVHCQAFTAWADNLGLLWGGAGAGSGPSHALIGLGTTHMGAIGETVQNPAPSPNVGMNYVPINNASECESGNEPYTGSQSIGNPPGLQPTVVAPQAAAPEVQAEARRAGLLDPPPWEAGR